MRLRTASFGAVLLGIAASAGAQRAIHVLPPGEPPSLAASVDAEEGVAADLVVDASSMHRPLQANACEVAAIVCDKIQPGALNAGDCTLDDGTLVDLYSLQGASGQLVAATVRPLDARYTDPVVLIVPPLGNASRPPASFGGPAGTVWYRITSNGAWSVGVGTRNLFATGPYVQDTYCEVDDGSGQCIAQELLCNQMQAWYLATQSCRYTSRPDLFYQRHIIYGVAGDTLNFEMLSSDFRPLFGLYDERGTLLSSSSAVGNSAARLSHRVTTSGFYYVTATAREDFSFGFYTLGADCSQSGCLYPLILQQPDSVETSYGNRVAISLDVHHVGPIEYRWYDATSGVPQPIATTRTPNLLTPPITGESHFYMTASSPCGTAESELIRVRLDPGRRRAVRK